MTNIKIAAAARRAGLAGLMGAVSAATVIGFAGAAHADPIMLGPGPAKECWQGKQHLGDCTLMSAAMAIGGAKGLKEMPTELQMLELSQA